MKAQELDCPLVDKWAVMMDFELAANLILQKAENLVVMSANLENEMVVMLAEKLENWMVYGMAVQ